MELGEIFEIVSYFTGAKNALVKFDFFFFFSCFVDNVLCRNLGPELLCTSMIGCHPCDIGFGFGY